MIDLLQAPCGQALRVVDIAGGENVRRRLFSLGLHPGDRVECVSRGILGGPLLIRPRESGSTIALGRGIARKIIVEVVHETS
jgi:ferrous iron transport protein A